MNSAYYPLLASGCPFKLAPLFYTGQNHLLNPFLPLVKQNNRGSVCTFPCPDLESNSSLRSLDPFSKEYTLCSFILTFLIICYHFLHLKEESL